MFTPPTNEREKIQYLISIVCLSLSIGIAIIFFNLPSPDPETYTPWVEFMRSILPNFFVALFGFAVVYFVLTRQNIDVGEYLKQSIIDNNKKMVVELQEEINLLKTKLRVMDQQLVVSQNIFELVKNRNSKVSELLLNLQKSSLFSRDLGSFILKNYFEGFRIIEKGFNIRSEFLSLYVYIQVWKFLVAQQALRKEKAEPCLIARIVHSNSIHIWTNEHDKYKETTSLLLKLQKEFVEYGGIAVRILIGDEDKPNEEYLKAMRILKDHKIESKYLQQSAYLRLDYDFLMLYDEKLILKWFSDQKGDSLAGSLIQNFIEPDVEEKWDMLFNKLEDKGDRIRSIPEEREYGLRIKKNTILKEPPPSSTSERGYLF